jgi:Cellulase (glycosyl hydrolase family 5)/Divergent InlB B-repeat domain
VVQENSWWVEARVAAWYKLSRAYQEAGMDTKKAAASFVTVLLATFVRAGAAFAQLVPSVGIQAPGDSLATVANGGVVPVTGLRVSGNNIVNGAGQVVPLRGVDKAGTEYMCLSGNVFDGPTDQASIDAMKAWQINIVRLPINEDCWLGINGQPSGLSAATYQTTIVNYVNLLATNNIAAIIDLQWAAPGTTVSNQLTPMPDADHAPAFWTSVANTFKSTSTVIFDLFNEPYPDNNADTTAAWTCLLNGGTCPGVSYTAAGMQSLVNTIRATGATNVIMSPGVQFTNTLTSWLAYKPTDPLNNLAASWHSYATQICTTQACWDSVIKPVLNSVPLVAGEIGENDCQGTYIDPLMTWLDMNGGNYLAWAWNTYDCASFPSLISAYDGTPTAFGVEFRNHLLVLAGRLAPPELQVFPPTNIVTSGPQGGPFSPSSFSYTLSATSGSVDFSISSIPTWLTASPISGTASSGTAVTFTINASANSLVAGTYPPATITFTNLDTGQGTTTVNATLTVNPRGLQVTPASNIVASGTQGGPFTLTPSTYTLSATSGSVKYTITVPGWLTASPTSGTVTTKATSVTFKINTTGADKLSVGTNISTINFNDTTHNQVTTRVATLIVNPKEYTIKVSASPGADGTVSGGGTFVGGTSETVTATPKSGHTFLHWTENGRVVSTSESYTFTLSANITLVADFK